MTAFQKLQKVWKRESLAAKVKIQLYRSLVLTTLLYGPETWNMSEAQEQRIDAFGHKCLRKIIKIKWNDYIKNQKIREDTDQPQISQLIRKK